MRALVTGGAGFIGAALVRRLLDEGAEVTVVDDGSAGGFRRLEGLAELDGPRSAGGRALTLHRLDVRAPGLRAAVAAAAPEVVFHLAAQIDVGRSVADPLGDASVNVLGTLAVLEAVRHLPRPGRVLLAASGGSLYGPEQDLPRPTPEHASRAPASPYGLSKQAAAEYLDAYRRLHGLEGCSLALANVYGPGQGGGGEAAVVSAFVEAVATGRGLVIHGDGEQTRDLVYVDDVVDAFVRAATKGGGLVCNIGTGTETSVNQLYQAMAQQAGDVPEPIYRPARPGEVRRSSLDIGRAAIQLGWRPWTPLDQGTGSVLDFVRTRRPAP